MSDLTDVLPNFDAHSFSHLLHSLQKNEVTVAELISLDPTEIARRCPLPLLDVRRLANTIIEHLQRDPKMISTQPDASEKPFASTTKNGLEIETEQAAIAEGLRFISTGDTDIDELLGGGLPAGYITEVVGESAVGKSQFLFGLLLSVQLPPPLGLGKSAIYISTEDELNTRRLEQILEAHPRYQQLPDRMLPSFSHVRSMTVGKLDAQQQILEFQLPLAIRRYDAGLVVIDSVAANFRAEHETSTAAGLAKRSEELAKMGHLLRSLAVKTGVAIVVANQVSDRFLEKLSQLPDDLPRSSSPASSAIAQNGIVVLGLPTERTTKLTMDHQQRFFTGWGDQPSTTINEKTPALGLTWANQINARIVLKVEEEYTRQRTVARGRKRRRFMSLVFAPWKAGSLKPLEYNIQTSGIVATPVSDSKIEEDNEAGDVLDESVWQDDEEFP